MMKTYTDSERGLMKAWIRTTGFLFGIQLLV